METKEKKLVGFATLDSCVRAALMDIGAGMERYEQFLHWCIEGFNDLHFDVLKEIKTVELEMTPWKAIEWPSDYVDWVLIGRRIGGQIAVFTNDNNIALAHDYETDDDLDPLPNDTLVMTEEECVVTSQKYWFFNSNSHGEDTGGLFGLAVKDNGLGYYRINKQRREIQFNPLVTRGSIYLEYISNGYDPCSKTTVNLYAAKLLKLYIHWQRLLYARSSTGAQKQEAERLYWDEFRRVADRLSDLTIEDVLEVSRNSYLASPFI
jgi:hypothetical protein